MVGVILKILSIAGIILLILLELILLILFLVLFVPLRYRIEAQKSPQSQYLTAKAVWLLGIFRIKAAFPDPGTVTARVLFFKVYDSSSKKESGKKSEKESRKESGKKEKEEPDHTDLTKEDSQDETDSPAISARADDNSQQEDFAAGVGMDQDAEFYDLSDEKSEESSGGKGIKEKILEKFEKFQYTVKKIYDRIKGIKKEAEFYKRLAADEKTKLLIDHLWFRLGRVLKAIRPRKLKARIRFGAETPDVTGYVCGVYGILASVLGKNFVFLPVFEEKCLEGELYAAGHIRVITLLIHVLKIYFDKNFKLLRSRLKNHSEKVKKH